MSRPYGTHNAPLVVQVFHGELLSSLESQGLVERYAAMYRIPDQRMPANREASREPLRKDGARLSVVDNLVCVVHVVDLGVEIGKREEPRSPPVLMPVVKKQLSVDGYQFSVCFSRISCLKRNRCAVHTLPAPPWPR